MSITLISDVVLISSDGCFLSLLILISLLGRPGHRPEITAHRVVCDGSGQDPLYMPTKKAGPSGLFQVKMSMKMIQS